MGRVTGAVAAAGGGEEVWEQDKAWHAGLMCLRSLLSEE